MVQVFWGPLDYLIIDTPPGTSDEHISIVQYLRGTEVDGAVVVTTPQEVGFPLPGQPQRAVGSVLRRHDGRAFAFSSGFCAQVSLVDVRKELSFCRKSGLKVLGVVENMARMAVPVSTLVFRDPTSGEDKTEQIKSILAEASPELLDVLAEASIFAPAAESASSAKQMAADFGAPYLGQVPLDPMIGEACERGLAFLEEYPGAPAAESLRRIVDNILRTTADSAEA